MATDVKVSLTIEGTDAEGKKSSTKIPYINPTISNETMKDFAEKCAALSNDTYIGTTKTTEEDITNGGEDKPTPTYSWNDSYVTDGKITATKLNELLSAESFTGVTITFTDLRFEAGTVFSLKTKTAAQAIFTKASSNAFAPSYAVILIAAKDNQQVQAGDFFTISIPETDTTAAIEITLTVGE